jgi:hypothetical protein
MFRLEGGSIPKAGLPWKAASTDAGLFRFVFLTEQWEPVKQMGWEYQCLGQFFWLSR